MLPVPKVYVLPRCAIDLCSRYVDTAGTLYWSAKNVENVQVTEDYEIVWRENTGMPDPVPHVTRERHELTMSGLWDLEAKALRPSIVWPYYYPGWVLVVGWRDAGLGASTSAWARRIYLDVVITHREIVSRDGNEFISSLTLVSHKAPTEATGMGELAMPSDPAPP